MRKINKTAILLVCTILFTGCAKEEKIIISGIENEYITKTQKKDFKNVQPIPLTRNQYIKLVGDKLDIPINSTEYKVRSGFFSEEDVFVGNVYWEDLHVTWPRTFTVTYNDEYKVGFINEDSDIVIQPKYNAASNFHDGVASVRFPCTTTVIVESPNSKIENTYSIVEGVYINESDSIIDKLVNYFPVAFSDGTATISDRADLGTYFEIDKDGDKLYGGMDNVIRTDYTGNKLGYLKPYKILLSKGEYNVLVDEFGEILIGKDEKFLAFEGAGNDYVFGIKNFADEYINYSYLDRVYGSYDVRFAVLDTEGNPVSKWIDYNVEKNLLMNKYMYDSKVNDGLILIYDTTTEKFGYLSTTGEIVIEPIYAGATRFSEGLACVSDGENYGFINTKGELVIPMKYPILNEQELSFNTQHYAKGITTEMLPLLEPLFQYSRFTEGVCPVRENRKIGLINKNGDYVVAPIFDELSNVTGGIATGKIDNSYYILEKIEK